LTTNNSGKEDNMSTQKVLVILKPDCIQRGLSGEILAILKQSGLQVLKQELRTLEESEVLRLYEEHSQSDTFHTLVSYMLSGPCLVLLLSGHNAVRTVSCLKGRTGSGKGIRGKYAENFIRNIIHSAETELKTAREILMFFKTEEINMQKNKVIFGLSGMTECGKSTAGVYFDSHGVKRLKIVKILDLVRIEQEPGASTEVFVNEAIKTKPEWLRQAFADKLLDEMDRLGIRYCSLESMGDPEMVKYLRARFPGEFFSVYIDASLDKRLEHQMIRKGLSDIEEAKRILNPKDEFKTNFWKMPDIKVIADVVIDNNGTLQSFESQLGELLLKHEIE